MYDLIEHLSLSCSSDVTLKLTDLVTGYGVPAVDIDNIHSSTDLLDTLERCYLLSRHNPYFLIWLLQKSKADSLAKKLEAYNKESQKVGLEFFSATESAGM